MWDKGVVVIHVCHTQTFDDNGLQNDDGMNTKHIDDQVQGSARQKSSKF